MTVSPPSSPQVELAFHNGLISTSACGCRECRRQRVQLEKQVMCRTSEMGGINYDERLPNLKRNPNDKMN